ncbi:Ribonucleotide reductase of class 3 (anaerobic), activating protein [Desulfurella amilsii]|uniref:Ribonucleotide reductase of class 3 (Anaerobic), activating protein n=1 Tax=Desulfurella amilsii TaxID=1562698 RepID=A0A1X4XYP5_9BACT|nr:anaerobic ribonucleoside-triphosphate reductase activating protein [Desulfurella amilsii]OSS42657.1 Ribonucleotide reductase of class 3 (anaerobic), activating protein [Desulfurella amilsii]
MKIAATQKVSFIDYPGKIATVLFCPFCNLRCPYCHNPELVFFKGNLLDEKDVLSFLQSRIGKIEAVVITGGEPTMQLDLADFIIKIKRMNFLVKLDTNGHFPDMLESVIDTVDVIALDLKATCDKYKAFGGDCEKLKESLKVLRRFKGQLIIRTTMYPLYTSKEDLEVMDKIIPEDLRFKRQFNEYRDTVTLQKFVKQKTINQKTF